MGRGKRLPNLIFFFFFMMDGFYYCIIICLYYDLYVCVRLIVSYVRACTIQERNREREREEIRWIVYVCNTRNRIYGIYYISVYDIVKIYWKKKFVSNAIWFYGFLFLLRISNEIIPILGLIAVSALEK